MRQYSSARTASVQIKLAKIMALVPVDRAPVLPRGAQRPRGQQLRSPAGADRLPDQPVGVHCGTLASCHVSIVQRMLVALFYSGPAGVICLHSRIVNSVLKPEIPASTAPAREHMS